MANWEDELLAANQEPPITLEETPIYLELLNERSEAKFKRIMEKVNRDRENKTQEEK